MQNIDALSENVNVSIYNPIKTFSSSVSNNLKESPMKSSFSYQFVESSSDRAAFELFKLPTTGTYVYLNGPNQIQWFIMKTM